MDSTDTSPPTATTDEDQLPDQALNRVIKRFGGRHLIFRTQAGSWRWLPRSYAMISTFRGPIWFFYGVGQVWVTHKKYRDFDGWMARVPRIPAPQIVALLDSLTEPITQFTHHCNEHGIEGTVVLEAKVIEFHWTFCYELEKEKQKSEKCDLLDVPFQKLVDAYLAAKANIEF